MRPVCSRAERGTALLVQSGRHRTAGQRPTFVDPQVNLLYVPLPPGHYRNGLAISLEA